MRRAPAELKSTVTDPMPVDLSRSVRAISNPAVATVTLWPAAPHAVATGSFSPLPE